MPQLSLVKFWLHVESFRASAISLTPGDNALLEMIKSDTSNIYSKYICIDAPCSIGLTESLRKRVIDNICQVNGKVDAHGFDDAQKFVWDIMERRYFKEFMHSVYYAKHQLEVLQNGNLTLDVILKTHSLLCAFIEFLDDQHGRNLLEFVIAVESFNQELKKTVDPEIAVDDAIIIYDKYFSMQATNSLNFGNEIRVEVEAKICTESGFPTADAFEKSQKMASDLLKQKFIPLFFTSPHFQKIVNELISAIDNYLELPNPNKPRTSSEKSSDTSVSFPSNLSEKRNSSSSSWTGSLKQNHRQRTVSFDRSTYSRSSTLNGDEDTPSSSRSIGTPATPKRKLNSPLAKVDEYGRYTPLFDNSLSVADESATSARDRLRHTLDEFIHKSAAKERLIADEVAELIISDIQRMVTNKKAPSPRKNL
uniref:RGS domain-containing protein n=1 Tax=Acrobeloides nanus TaxID=290746 RepID=A0A914CYA6_9BILA